MRSLSLRRHAIFVQNNGLLVDLSCIRRCNGSFGITWPFVAPKYVWMSQFAMSAILSGNLLRGPCEIAHILQFNFQFTAN